MFTRNESAMPNLIEGDFSTPQVRFAIIAARFNSLVVDPLVAGAVDTLVRHGVADRAIDLIRVPGSFEIPLIARKAADSAKYGAVICLGAIIRGDTGHYDHVAGGATSGVASASLESGIPVIFGILTCDTVEQALNRAGLKAGNKGAESAMVAIEMVNLIQKLEE
jgi:6,7-dimethyl-8-ribityllumazine synthase